MIMDQRTKKEENKGTAKKLSYVHPDTQYTSLKSKTKDRDANY